MLFEHKTEEIGSWCEPGQGFCLRPWNENEIINEWMNECKRLLAEIKNIQLNTNNNIQQYIHQRCYQVTNNIYGNPKSLNSS